MRTSFITSPDGTQITYDVIGKGPVIILLHGGGIGWSRKKWHQVGYVARLKDKYKVISIDIRGNGESGKPILPTDYAIDRICEDILAVADACEVERFIIWGYSYGGNIGRFLAARSERVSKIIIVGIPLGLAASGEFRQFIYDFRDHWKPLIQAQLDGTLELNALSKDDQTLMKEMDIPVTLAWLVAMLDWGVIEPADLPCSTLWLSGSENKNTIDSMKNYEPELKKSNVQVQIIKGLDHVQEFEKIDLVFPVMLAFTIS
ncbi:MAG: alpha/beta hydrolase [Chloroflexota bacterium]